MKLRLSLWRVSEFFSVLPTSSPSGVSVSAEGSREDQRFCPPKQGTSLSRPPCLVRLQLSRGLLLVVGGLVMGALEKLYRQPSCLFYADSVSRLCLSSRKSQQRSPTNANSVACTCRRRPRSMSPAAGHLLPLTGPRAVVLSIAPLRGPSSLLS